jgi:predicted nucleic acid-binding protein
VTAVFLDTSGVFAAARPGSDRHAEARAVYESLLRGSDRLVTTDLVLAELHALTLHRAGPGVALDLVSRLAASNRIEVVAVGRERLDDALDLLAARPGRRYSLADGASFVVMRDMGATVAFTLDADFAAEGFTVLPAAPGT